MFSHEITQEAMAMTDTRPQFVSAGRTLRMALLLPAAALIFLGSMIQLGMLGYGQLNPRDFWPAAMIFQSAWDLLAANLSATGLSNIFQFWPLLLVVCGLGIMGILYALKPSNNRKPARPVEIRRRISSW
jgi:hypothetical protein